MASQRLDSRQQARQKQRLALSPAMRQSLSVLEMDGESLREHISEIADRNCLLEVEPWTPAAVEDFAPISEPQETWAQVKRRLRVQLHTLQANPQAMHAAEFLLEELDERGYLPPEAEEDCLAEGYLPKDTAAGILLLQSLEPRGIGGRDLAEVLLLQLEPDETLAREIVSEHLYDVANWDIDAIRDGTDAGESEILRAIGRIKSLCPRPLQNTAAEPARYLVPELMLTAEDGSLTLSLVRRFPEIRVSALAAQALRESDDARRSQLLSQLQEAQSLTDAISRRSRTLYRTAEQIVQRQAAFFLSGAPLTAMTQAEIAEALDLSISTVSRAVSGQTLLYQNKTYALKDLFTSSTASGASRAQVQQAIRLLIEGENPRAPRSDGAIARVLSSEGATVSRRTVTKYRTAMGIPPAEMRKQNNF